MTVLMLGSCSSQYPPFSSRTWACNIYRCIAYDWIANILQMYLLSKLKQLCAERNPKNSCSQVASKTRQSQQLWILTIYLVSCGFPQQQYFSPINSQNTSIAFWHGLFASMITPEQQKQVTRKLTHWIENESKIVRCSSLPVIATYSRLTACCRWLIGRCRER